MAVSFGSGALLWLFAGMTVASSCGGGASLGDPSDAARPAEADPVDDVGVPVVPTTVEADVFRIAPVGSGFSGIVYGPDGVFHPTRHIGFAKVVDGPISIARDAFLTGVVYQRPGDNRRIFGSGGDELVVAAENETIEFVGIRYEPTDGNLSHVLYTSRITSTPEATTETLRSYNRKTGEVTEIYETGGWESGTDFGYAHGEWAVGRWSGEGFVRFDVVSVITGEIKKSFPAEGDCFEGESQDGCLPFTVAALAGEKIYGFGPSRNDAGVVDSMTLYELDTRITQLIPLASFPWEDGLYYPVDIWVSGALALVSLSTAQSTDEGQPLPALIYNLETDEASTMPESGYLHRAFFN